MVRPRLIFTIGARYDRMMEAFGGKGWYIEDSTCAPPSTKPWTSTARRWSTQVHHEATRKPQDLGDNDGLRRQQRDAQRSDHVRGPDRACRATVGLDCRCVDHP